MRRLQSAVLRAVSLWLVAGIGHLVVPHVSAQTLDEAARLNQQAIQLYQQGRYADAEPLYKRSLAIGERAFGPDHPDVAQSLNNLAKLYDSQGHYAEAEPLYKRSVAVLEKVVGRRICPTTRIQVGWNFGKNSRRFSPVPTSRNCGS